MRGCGGDAIEAFDSNLVLEIEMTKTTFEFQSHASSWFYSEWRAIQNKPPTFMSLRYRYNFVAAISTSLRKAETAALTTSGERHLCRLGIRSGARRPPLHCLSPFPSQPALAWRPIEFAAPKPYA
jgi:hypothetical protein